MRVAILGTHARRQRLGPRPNDCLHVWRPRRERLKMQRRLALADQLDIDRGQQLGVEQRAVLRAASPTESQEKGGDANVGPFFTLRHS
jgi:hypothetical protein